MGPSPDALDVPVIAGPTAGGKSAAAVHLALALPERLGREAEIVSADAFQIYCGMDIGTAKPGPAERGGVGHHLIDIVEPTEPFTVHQWLEHANRAIEAIAARGRVPIVVGGTHLYIKALLDGLFEGPGADADLRARLHAMAPDQRRADLERVDPDAAARIHPNDVRRTVRALEVYRLTGRTITDWQRQWDRASESRASGLRLFWLDWPGQAINRRINARVKAMVDSGLVEEVRALHEAGRLGDQAGQALGYKQIAAHLEGRCTLEEAIERTKIETRRFAKNQRTWLKRLGATPGAVRLAAGDADADPEAWARTILGHLAPTQIY